MNTETLTHYDTGNDSPATLAALADLFPAQSGGFPLYALADDVAGTIDAAPAWALGGDSDDCPAWAGV